MAYRLSPWFDPDYQPPTWPDPSSSVRTGLAAPLHLRYVRGTVSRRRGNGNAWRGHAFMDFRRLLTDSRRRAS
jgi:hypothetical protein